MPQTATKPHRSVANERLKGPFFADGAWHCLNELETFEAELSAVRQQDKAFSDSVRIDTSSEEKLRRDELTPLRHFARGQELPLETRFRKPKVDRGVDIELILDGAIYSLQICTAYQAWPDREGKYVNGGYQHRLSMEKLTSLNLTWGSGPFVRRGDEIWNHEGCTSQADEEQACLKGIVEAFKLKSTHGSKDVILLVGAICYSEVIFDPKRFCALVDKAAKVSLPSRFAKVIVVSGGSGFFWSTNAEAHAATSE